MVLCIILAAAGMIYIFFGTSSKEKKEKESFKYNISNDKTEVFQDETQMEIDKREEDAYTGIEEPDYEPKLKDGYCVVIDNKGQIPAESINYADSAMIDYFMSKYFNNTIPNHESIIHTSIDIDSLNITRKNVSFIFYLTKDISQNFIYIYDLENHGAFIDTIDIARYSISNSDAIETVINQNSNISNFEKAFYTYMRYYLPDETNFEADENTLEDTKHEIKFIARDTENGDVINCRFEKIETQAWSFRVEVTEEGASRIRENVLVDSEDMVTQEESNITEDIKEEQPEQNTEETIPNEPSSEEGMEPEDVIEIEG